MLNPDIQMEVGKVGVVTSDNGGLTAEQLTELCVNKIVYVSDNAPPAIKEQAKQFKAVITNIIFQYIQLAKKEERATIVNKVLQTGNNELSEIIRRL